MRYLIIFLVVLKSHPLLTLLGLIVVGFLASLILPKKIKVPVISCVSIIFLIWFINIFAGHFVTNLLIDNLGDKGEGMVVDISETSDLYNDQPVLRFNVMIKSDTEEVVSTYCLTSDFNISHTASYNEYTFPQPGVKFNARFLKEYPKAFVIIANDDSDYSKGLLNSKDADEIASLQNQLKMDPKNPATLKKLDELLKKRADR